MSSQAMAYLTPAQYLELERRAETRSEYHDGQMFAMAGTSHRHARILMNLSGQLWAMLRGSTCEVVTTDIRLHASPRGLYTYPDLMVVCGPRFVDEVTDMIDNPTVIVEVLSTTTEAYDRGAKFESYRTLESLQEYLLVAQDRMHIEQYTRQRNGTWLLREASDGESVIELPSVGASVKVGDVYERLDFSKT